MAEDCSENEMTLKQHKGVTKEEFEQVWMTYYEPLFYYACAFVGDSEAARDVVSGVFERVWMNRDEVKGKTLQKFLYVSVRNKSMDYLRHASAERNYVKYISEATAYQDELTHEEREQRHLAVEQAVKELPEPIRYVLSECYLGKRKYKDVAEELGVTRDAVKKRISKALALLRERLNRKS